MSYRQLFHVCTTTKKTMAYNRVLKMNLVLLVLVLIGIGASSFALYAGNKRFIGILAIALLALFLVFWRIFSLTREPATVSDQKDLDIDLDLDLIQRIRPPQKWRSAFGALLIPISRCSLWFLLPSPLTAAVLHCFERWLCRIHCTINSSTSTKRIPFLSTKPRNPREESSSRTITISKATCLT